ncbi:MAG TPA: class IV adenylate cyclase [Tepidisphaeraceae bacterium]
MRRNIEIKARCRDLGAARDAARRLGAAFSGMLEQRDTYFIVPHGRLKLRETVGTGAELIAYQRLDAAAVRGSDYQLVAVADPAGLREALEAALGVRGEVIKTRELWMWRGVRIHLDQVRGLGAFLEFEAVLEAGEDDRIGYEKVATLREALGVGDEDLLGASYADLLVM